MPEHEPSGGDSPVVTAGAPSALDEAATGQAVLRPARPSFYLLGVAAVVAGVTFAALVVMSAVDRNVSAWVAFVGFITTMVLAGWAGLRAFGTLVLNRQALTKGQVVNLLVAMVASLFGFVVSLGLVAAFTRGRQLRRGGRVLLPEVGEGSAWPHLGLSPSSFDGETRAGLAAQWRENGRTEHASVAAFAQLTLDLMALGAPPELLSAAQHDALDEIRHAELCFSLATALDGRHQGPAEFRPARKTRSLPAARDWALAQLAVDSLVEGALLEGFSARLLSKLVGVCEDPATAQLIKELAADEGRHSRHGWDVVSWCLREGGSTVAAALLGAVEALPQYPRNHLTDAAREGRWQRFGVPGAALESLTYREARAHVVERVHAVCAGARTAGAGTH